MKMQTPETLKTWRTRRGWTIPYAADYFGVGERTWWRWENERIAYPRLITLATSLVDALSKKSAA